MDAWQGLRRVGVLVGMLGLLPHCGAGADAESPAPGTAQQELSTLAFTATADLSVRPDVATSGSARTLEVGGTPTAQGYLRFNVAGLSGTVARATLRLWVLQGDASRPLAGRTTSRWSETNVTWSNRPALGVTPSSEATSAVSGTWMEVDVTATVRANGEVNFVLYSGNSQRLVFASREALEAARRPQLVVQQAELPPASCLPRAEQYTVSERPYRDGYGSQGQPTTSFESASALDADASPRTEAHLQFYIFGEGARAVSARLRLLATDGSADGPRVYADGQWPQEFFTWNTRPGLLGAPLADLGTVTAGSAYEVDVSPFVRSEGVYGFGLSATSSDAARFASNDVADEAQHARLSVRFETEPFCTYRGDGTRGRMKSVRRLGGAGRDTVVALAADAQGHVAIAHAGLSFDSGYALARYGTDGLPAWARTMPPNVAPRALVLTPLGNVLLVGSYTGAPDLGTGALVASGAGTPTLFIAKYSPTGRPLWSRGFVAMDDRQEPMHWPVTPTAVATDANGSLIVTGFLNGHTDFGGGLIDGGPSSIALDDAAAGAFLAKFDFDGNHLWSRVMHGHITESAELQSVSTDANGRIFVGGLSTLSSDFGDGQTGVRGPVVAAYEPSGALVWRRVFTGASGLVNRVRASGANRVAFSAELGLEFFFGSDRFVVSEEFQQTKPFLGVLGNSGGEDAWIRAMEGPVASLSADGGSITAAGFGTRAFDLGGGGIGNPQLPASLSFIARFDALESTHLWSRSLPTALGLAGHSQRPDGTLVLGLALTGSTSFDGVTLTSNGSTDLVYLQLAP
jgi:hypothetical protein